MASPLAAHQLHHLTEAMHLGASRSSVALSTWLTVPATVGFDSFEQLSLSDAADVLGDEEDPLCFCLMDLRGDCRGAVILAFDDASGMALSDLVLGRPTATATEWGDVETSAALETANIIACAYLNAITECFRNSDGASLQILPSPPSIRHEFAQCLLQAVVMGQAEMQDNVMLGRANFVLRGQRLNWTLLFVPDADSMRSMGKWQRQATSTNETGQK